MLLALTLGVARGAEASPLFELIGGGQGSGGFNARVTGPSASSAYFNPALLPYARQGLELGVFVLADRIGISVDARDSAAICKNAACDVPLVRGAAPESFRHSDGSPIANPPLPTVWLDQGRKGTGAMDDGLPPRPRQGQGDKDQVRPYQMLGLVSPIFGQKLVLGLHAMIPLQQFTTASAFYNDEREQYFSNSLHPELYADRLTATSLAFGIGSRVAQRFSLGVTFTLSLKNTASAPVYISNLSNLNTLLIDSNIGVETAVAPHFGLAWDPLDDLRITATVHTPQAFEIESSFDYLLATGSKQGAGVKFTHDYVPLTGALGASYTIGHFALVGTASFERWSQYRDRHSERPVDDYAWSDTLSGSVGVRHAVGALDTYLDVTYQPSPVPAQSGRSNYVDNDRIATCVGANYQFKVLGAQFRAGLQAQVHRLTYRHVTKFVAPANPQPNPALPGHGGNDYPQLVIDEVPDDAVDGQLHEPVPGRTGLQTNNPGFPGFSSEGWLLGGSAHLAVLY